MKTIGICIPTYKRPDFLRRCLASIIDQADGLPVQIFVADDSCSDANDAVLREAALRFPALRHQKNEANLGINENIRRVVEMADTDYAWLVGEDDYFLPGALGRAVLEVGSSNNPFVLCNYALVEDSSAAQARPALDVSVDTTLTADEVIRRYLWSAGFMGACLFDLRSWRRVASDRYRGTYYAHVGHIVEMLDRPDRPVRILGAPLVSNRAEGPEAFTWRTDALGVFFGFERMCAIAASVVPALTPALDEAALVYREKQRYLSTRSMARMRADGIMAMSTYRLHLQPAHLPAATRFAALAMVLMPRGLFRAALAAKRWVGDRNSGTA